MNKAVNGKLLPNHPNKKTNHQKDHSLVVQATAFSGPLPPPQVLAQYESILPGSANRILSMAEKQSEHRRSIEKKVISTNVENETKGMWYAFWLTLSFAVIGGLLIYSGNDIQGFITLIGTGLFQVANYFIVKRKENQVKKTTGLSKNSSNKDKK